MKNIICTISILFLLTNLCYAYTPEEAENIYRTNECSMVSQTTDNQCFECSVKGEAPECLNPLNIDITVHWNPSWEVPIQVLPPEPVKYPIVISAVSDAMTTDGWTVDNQWLHDLPESGVNRGTGTDGPHAEYQITSTANTLYLWVHGVGTDASSDSISYGVDGLRIGSLTFIGGEWSNSRQYDSSKQAVLNTSADEFKLDIWGREDGLKFDLIHLSNEPNYAPN